METEPEWDDEERTRMLALRKYERDICACGFPSALTADKANHFAINQRQCPVCARSDQYMRMVAEADDRHDKQAGDKAPAASPRPSDGRQISLSLMSPDEVTQLKKRGGARGNTPGKRPA